MPETLSAVIGLLNSLVMPLGPESRGSWTMVCRFPFRRSTTRVGDGGQMKSTTS
jgi:hypothetical protein